MAAGQHAAIEDIANIKFEYFNRDSLSGTGSPLIVLVPGFTQHNRTPEFTALKHFFMTRGFSFLIMNPPQHGEDYHYKKTYSWGENEVDDLALLADSLDLWQKHSEIHLLGFSIGAKIVLRFAARAGVQEAIASVAAVAPPYRVGEINMRPATDHRVVNEALRSKFRALQRSSFGRLLYMTLIGMPKSMLLNRATPASEISRIQAPTLLLHAANDWLTKSFHSARLFSRAMPDQRVAFVALNTKTHAEDMLSRAGAETKTAFLATIDAWLNFVDAGNLPDDKKAFNRDFQREVGQSDKIQQQLFPATEISDMSTPTLYDFATGAWQSAADYNHSKITITSALQVNRETRASHFFTFGSTKVGGTLLQRTRLGLSFQQNGRGDLSRERGHLSLFYPFGSFIWVRRLTFEQEFRNSASRVFSADLAFLILDFQLRYGRTVQDNRNDIQLGFNFPLYANARASRFFGFGYTRFLSGAANARFKSTAKFYLAHGPNRPWAGTRWRAILQYEQRGLNSFDTRRIWSVGLSVNVDEE